MLEYNAITMEITNEIFATLKERNYRKYNTCQLPRCEKEIQKTGIGRRNKYCSKEHFLQAKKLYKEEWEKRNRSKVLKYKRNYYLSTKNETKIS